jgi:hypothetical protein
MSLERSLDEKYKTIKEIMQWFELPAEDKDTIKSKLAQDNFDVCNYLDAALTPLIPELIKARKAQGTTSSILGSTSLGYTTKPEDKLRVLISMCFSGDLSQKAWKEICKYLNEEDIVFYATTFYYLGEPVAIAARNRNKAALKNLNEIYKTLLPKYPDRQKNAHDYLQRALQEVLQYVKADLPIDTFFMVLNMCYELSAPGNLKQNNPEISNRNFYTNMTDEGVISLLDVFANACFHYSVSGNFSGYGFNTRHIWAMATIYDFVALKGSAKDLYLFKNKLIELLLKSPLLKNPEEFSAACEQAKALDNNLSFGFLAELMNAAKQGNFIPSDFAEAKVLEEKSSITDLHGFFATPLAMNKLDKEYPEYEKIYAHAKNKTEIGKVLAFFKNYCETKTWRHQHINAVTKALNDFTAENTGKEPDFAAISSFLTKLKDALLASGIPVKSIADGGTLVKRIDFIQKKYELNVIDLEELARQSMKSGPGKK